jgi:hypothetical protein
VLAGIIAGSIASLFLLLLLFGNAIYRVTRRHFYKMKSWDRVLQQWRHEGHVGLTVHALACVLDKDDPEKLLDKLKDDPMVYAQFCTGIKAPVWCYTIGGIEHTESSKEPFYIMTKWSLENIPYPKYVSVQNMKGSTKLIGVTTTELEKLRKAARG